MSGKTKIVVLRMKEILYASVFAFLGILVVVLLALLLLSDKKSGESHETVASDCVYTPGIYTTELVLGGQTVELEVVVSATEITSIRLVNPNEAVTTMYPLLQPTLMDLGEQIYLTQSLEEVQYDSESKYTSFVLLEAIRSAVDRAKKINDAAAY